MPASDFEMVPGERKEKMSWFARLVDGNMHTLTKERWLLRCVSRSLVCKAMEKATGRIDANGSDSRRPPKPVVVENTQAGLSLALPVNYIILYHYMSF